MKFLPVILSCIVINISVWGQPVKVMTYNIRYDNPGDSVNAWPNRLDKVVKLIATYNPDLLGVQEALLHQLEYLIEQLPQYGYVGVGRDDGKKKGEFSAILYRKDRFNITDQQTFWLSQNPGIAGSKSWDAAITRIVTWIKAIDLKTGKAFLMLNTHFDHIGIQARRNSSTLLTQSILTLSKDLPVIVTGDFNFTRNDPAYNTITSLLTDPAPDSPPGTFCGFEVNPTECRPIDYIFHSPHWKAGNYKVISDNDGRYYPSDHLPVTVTLEITN